MNHSTPYPPDYLSDILAHTRTIAIVGASPDESRPSHQVLRFLHEFGYQIFPVNPRPDITEIHGLQVHDSLASIPQPIDMVDVFRQSAHLPQIAREAVSIKAKILWAQLGVFDEQAAKIAEKGGLRVVMNRCPQIELSRDRQD